MQDLAQGMHSSLYDTDFAAWVASQLRAFRTLSWNELDLVHLAEEIESLAKRDQWAIKRHLKVLLRHLLKWHYQTTRSPRQEHSWRVSIRNARDAIALRLDDSPSLRGRLLEALQWAYPRAREDAADDTGLLLGTFPDACPWTVDQILDRQWLP
jgi:hypothetical protein